MNRNQIIKTAFFRLRKNKPAGQTPALNQKPIDPLTTLRGEEYSIQEKKLISLLNGAFRKLLLALELSAEKKLGRKITDEKALFLAAVDIIIKTTENQDLMQLGGNIVAQRIVDIWKLKKYLFHYKFIKDKECQTGPIPKFSIEKEGMEFLQDATDRCGDCWLSLACLNEHYVVFCVVENEGYYLWGNKLDAALHYTNLKKICGANYSIKWK